VRQSATELRDLHVKKFISVSLWCSFALSSTECLVMSTESTPLISQSPTQYSSLPPNALFPAPKTLPSASKIAYYDPLSIYNLLGYLSASERLENRGCVARDHLGRYPLYAFRC
jgi:hypothetical protein